MKKYINSRWLNIFVYAPEILVYCGIINPSIEQVCLCSTEQAYWGFQKHYRSEFFPKGILSWPKGRAFVNLLIHLGICSEDFAKEVLSKLNVFTTYTQKENPFFMRRSVPWCNIHCLAGGGKTLTEWKWKFSSKNLLFQICWNWFNIWFNICPDAYLKSGENFQARPCGLRKTLWELFQNKDSCRQFL